MPETSSLGRRRNRPASIFTILSPNIGGSAFQHSEQQLSESAWSGILSGREGDEHRPLIGQILSDEPDSIDGVANNWNRTAAESNNTAFANNVKSKLKDGPAIRVDYKLGNAKSFEDAPKNQWLTQTHKNILKCAVAYFIASLFTYTDPLSDLVGRPFNEDGPVSNAHFIATVMVYFNPAKSIGNMVEANLFMVWASLFSLVVCFGSMLTAVILNREGYEWLSHAVVVVFWLTGSCAFIAYMKVKQKAKATFGSACSMAALIVSVIIIKEGAVHLGRFETDAILQMLYIVIIGTLISNIVCVCLWRVSATSLLQINITNTLDSFSTLTALLSNTFLLEEDLKTSQEQLKRAIAAHEASFSSLKSSLEDAKLELFDSRVQRSVPVYDDIVKSMTRLAQHLTGLRAGCSYQGRVLQARRAKRESFRKEHTAIPIQEIDSYGPEATVFLAFKQLVGPSLVSLSESCRVALLQARLSFAKFKHESSRDDATPPDFASVADQISLSLRTFSATHGSALKKLYRTPGQAPLGDVLQRSATQFNNDSESIFTVYFFLFNLEEFASELLELLRLCGIIQKEEERLRVHRRLLILKYGKIIGSMFATFGCSGLTYTSSGQKTHRLSTITTRLTTLIPQSKSRALFPKVENAAETSHQVDASKLSWIQYSFYRIWRFLLHLRDDDMKFAIKTGVGAGLLGLPAFLDSTRPLWVKYRGEWAMISYMVVIATTAAQSNFNALFRIAGTLLGAIVAVFVYHLFRAHPIALAVFGFFFSIPNFWLIVTRPKWATTGRFILLAYNLTALYAYNKREEDLHVGYIALRRSIAVCVGSLWGWLIATSVWPYEARRELRRGLAELFLNSAFLYKKLVQAYSQPPQNSAAFNWESVTESTGLLSDRGRSELSNEVKAFASMELALQRQLISLNGLLAQTQYEPRIKGPFPVDDYRRILQASQSILDQLHAMRCVTTREEWYSAVRKDFILPVQEQRREMVGNVLLYFSLLASLISLKTPTPLYMPPANRARERLLAAIRELDVVKKRKVKHSSTYLLFYAYCLSLKDLIDQLDVIGSITQNLFGVLGGSPLEFDAMFAPHSVYDAATNLSSGPSSAAVSDMGEH